MFKNSCKELLRTEKGGGIMGYQLIETVEVGSGGAASIEFTSIPQDGVDLLLVVSASNTTTSETSHKILLNGDTASDSNISGRILRGTGSSVASNNYSGIPFAVAYAGTGSTNNYGNSQIYFPNYTSSASKSISTDSVNENNATAANSQIGAWVYAPTSAITAIELQVYSGAFTQYSTASLYKITAD